MRALPAGRFRPHLHRLAAIAGERVRRVPTASAELAFARTLEAPSQAREAAGSVLAGWGVSEVAHDDLILMVSELVTNAVRYGSRGDVIMRLDLRAGGVLITVADGTPYVRLPEAAQPADDVECGRGLCLVDVLAEEWGHGPVGGSLGGMAVWARYRLGSSR